MESVLGLGWPTELYQFVAAMLYWDPAQRPSSTDALRHELFGGRRVVRSILKNPVRTTAAVETEQPQQSYKSVAKQQDLPPPSISSHRQSWFAKKKEMFTGRTPSAEMKDDPPARNTRSKMKDLLTAGMPRQVILNSMNDTQVPASLLQPPRPISPVRVTQPVLAHDRASRSLAKDQSFSRRMPPVGTSEGKHNGTNTEMMLSRVTASLSKKSIRSVSNMSLDSQPASKNSGVPGLEMKKAGLFSHLRKKHKPSEQDGRLPHLNVTAYPDRANPAPDARDQTFRSAAEHKHGQVPESLGYTHSFREPSVPNYSHTVKHGSSRNPGSLPTPKSPGPVSSRTRRATEQYPKDMMAHSSRHTYSNESELLDIELQSAAQAMMHLETQPGFSAPANKTPTSHVPSYARGTAASTRRASAFHTPQASTTTATPRAFRRRMSSMPPSPIEMSHRLPFSQRL